MVRGALGVLLLIPCMAISCLVVDQVWTDKALQSVWRSSTGFYFTLGCVMCVTLHFIPAMRFALLKAYVVGHEITHAIFVYMCYGRIAGFDVDTSGGYIIANRDNILVSLSPYIFPFWTFVAGIFYLLTGCVTNLSVVAFYFSILFGATWMFNIIWTVKMIPKGQTDLSTQGSFLSLTIIYFFNFLILSLLLVSAQSYSDLLGWGYQLINAHLDLFYLLIRR